MESHQQVSNQGSECLQVLSIFHYVIGGMVAVFSISALPFLGIGLWLILSPSTISDLNSTLTELFLKLSLEQSDFSLLENIPGYSRWLVLAAGIAYLAVGLTLAGCIIASGQSLARRKRYWFSFIVAWVESLLFIPFGTVLGFFTIVTLLKGSVRKLYSS
jgi:hypothetical protein